MQMTGTDVCLPRKEDMSHFPLSMIFTLFSDSFYVFYYAQLCILLFVLVFIIQNVQGYFCFLITLTKILQEVYMNVQ